MATKTTNIEVKVDETLAAAIADKAVKTWHATSYSNGKKRVYVTFEEVKTVGAGVSAASPMGKPISPGGGWRLPRWGARVPPVGVNDFPGGIPGVCAAVRF